MWTWFRAVAASIGLSPETVEEVERGGGQTSVQHPRNPNVQIVVRPDPDWTVRLGDAWEGTLVNSRRATAGTLPVADGRLLVGSPSVPDRVVAAEVVPGDYEVVVTVAHLGRRQTVDYEERVSHAFALLRGSEGAVALVEPLAAADGTEVFIDSVLTAFAGVGVAARIAEEQMSGGVQALDSHLIAEMHRPGGGRHWARVAPGVGRGALVAVSAPPGKYPLFRIADADGRTIGVMIDFYYDNRPYD
jgi:hypothetical protein